MTLVIVEPMPPRHSYSGGLCYTLGDIPLTRQLRDRYVGQEMATPTDPDLTAHGAIIVERIAVNLVVDTLKYDHKSLLVVPRSGDTACNVAQQVLSRLASFCSEFKGEPLIVCYRRSDSQRIRRVRRLNDRSIKRVLKRLAD